MNPQHVRRSFERWHWGILAAGSLLLFLAASSAKAITFADSVAQWSVTGTQGENNWFYGYYDRRADVEAGNGVYDPVDVIPFLNDGSNAISSNEPRGTWVSSPNHWNGSSWNLVAEGAATQGAGNEHGPWTELGQSSGHPAANAQLTPEVHWTVRRWVSDVAGPVHIHGMHLTSGNGGTSGDGTTRRIFHNGTEIHSGVSFGSPTTYNVGRTLAIGDTLDFIVDPNGLANAMDINLVNDGSDTTSLTSIIDDTPLPPPPPPPPVFLADSANDWSTTGAQGERNWFNGFYRRTIDTDATYSVDDVQLFENNGTNVIGPDGANHWNGSGFALFRSTGPDTGPWTSLGRNDTHPNGTNSAPPREVPGAIAEEHWTVRRWVADVSEVTPAAIDWHMRKTNLGGTGVTGKLFINGNLVDERTIFAGEGSLADAALTGTTRTFYANVSPGDVIDLALTPVGLSTGAATFDTADGADGSANRLSIRTGNLPANPMNPAGVVADTWADFSGVQGGGNWFYGIYDRSADLAAAGGDGVYQDGEFQLFDGGEGGGAWGDDQHWTGSAWDFNPDGASTGNPPWTFIDRIAGNHPNDNAPGPEHHVIRRWISEVDGTVQIEGFFRQVAAAGDGTRGRVLINGTEVFSIVTDAFSRKFSLTADLNEGDFVDFLIDTNNPADDGSDSTQFRATIELMAPVALIPEPSTYAMAVFGLLIAGWLARRRGKESQ